MIMKTLFAVAAVAATVAVVAPAQAGVKVYFGDGFYGDGYYGGGHNYPVYPVYDEPQYHQSYGISCEDGRQQVRYAGFRKVRALDCDGKRYTYRARRYGDTFIVKVNRRDGDIISINPAY